MSYEPITIDIRDGNASAVVVMDRHILVRCVGDGTDDEM